MITSKDVIVYSLDEIEVTYKGHTFFLRAEVDCFNPPYEGKTWGHPDTWEEPYGGEIEFRLFFTGGKREREVEDGKIYKLVESEVYEQYIEELD